jgi:hypothetical protein
MVKSGLEPSEGATQERLAELREAVAGVTTAQLLTALRAFGEADLKTDPNSTLPLDIALAECALAGGQSANESSRQQSSAPPPARPEPMAGRNLHPAPRETVSARPEPVEAHDIPSRPRETVSARSEAPEGRAGGPAEPRPADDATSPEPEPASVTLAGPVAPALSAARNQMRPIYEKARAAGFQLGALLNSGCDIIEADESGVVLGFRYPIHANKASEKQNLDALAAIFSEVMGRPLSLRCIESADVTAWTQRESASRSPLVRAAQEMGARILTSEPED